MTREKISAIIGAVTMVISSMSYVPPLPQPSSPGYETQTADVIAYDSSVFKPFPSDILHAVGKDIT